MKKLKIGVYLLLIILISIFCWSYYVYLGHKNFEGQTREILSKLFFAEGDILEIHKQTHVNYSIWYNIYDKNIVDKLKNKHGKLEEIDNRPKNILNHLSKRWWFWPKGKNKCGWNAMRFFVYVDNVIFESNPNNLRKMNRNLGRIVSDCGPYIEDVSVERTIFSHINSLLKKKIIERNQIDDEIERKFDQTMIRYYKKQLKMWEEDLEEDLEEAKKTSHPKADIQFLKKNIDFFETKIDEHLEQVD